MISWNQQDLTQFYKVQYNFIQTNEIYWNLWNPADFLKFNRFHAWNTLNKIIQEKNSSLLQSAEGMCVV